MRLEAARQPHISMLGGCIRLSCRLIPVAGHHVLRVLEPPIGRRPNVASNVLGQASICRPCHQAPVLTISCSVTEDIRADRCFAAVQKGAIDYQYRNISGARQGSHEFYFSRPCKAQLYTNTQ
jgi:hypothetical protein